MPGDIPPIDGLNELEDELDVAGVEEADLLNLVGIMAAHTVLQQGSEAGEDERVEEHEDEHGLYFQILPMKFGCGACRAHLANQLDLIGDVGEDMIQSRRMLVFHPNPNYMNVKIGEHDNPNLITREVNGVKLVMDVVKVYCTQCSKQVGYKLIQVVEPQDSTLIIPGSFILIKGQDRNVPSHMMRL